MCVITRLLAIGLLVGTVTAAKLGVVYTEGGMVQGRSHSMGLFRSVDVFKGVPFAEPPGTFQKPKPHPGWDGVLQATEYRDRCLQMTLMQSGTQGSEDCLYLNIFIPHGLTVSSDLPVMVYIFGGAFILGASDDVAFLGDSLYDGKEMADRGGVIVVTVNYRVGTLGFLSTGDDRIPGNYGLWDQHAAIAWVHRNIRGFGGDSDNITIFGQSAGAASVSYQMLSPYNKGLFRRAISQCGVALSPWALQTDPMTETKKIAALVGCGSGEDMAACLRATDPAALTEAGKLPLSQMGKGPVMNLLTHSPVVDGDFVPDHPSQLFHNAAAIDYLAGVNSMDGHMFAGVDVPSINKDNTPTTVEEVKGLLAGLTQEKGGGGGGPWGPAAPQAEVKKTVADIETDFLFLVPTQIALHLHAAHSSGGRTYSYLFNMETRFPGFPSWVEAMHAEDVQYVFGKPHAQPLIYLPRHRTLSDYMIAYWTNFAKTGDPSKGNSKVPTPWPVFSGAGHPYLVINNKINKASVRQGLRADYVRYWTTVYTHLPSASTQE